MSLKIFNKKLLLIAQITIFALLLVNSETNKSLGEDAITPTSSQVNSIASETTPTNPANSASSNPASPSPATTTTENKDANPDEKLTPKENIIYIPYEKFNRNFGVNNGGVFVPYDEYKQLWESAQKNKYESIPPKTPINSMITESSGTVKVLDDIVQVESTLDIELLKDGWHEIPIRLGDTAITKAEINKEPAKIIGNQNSGYKLIVEKKKIENTKNKNENKNEITPQRLKLTLNFAKSIAKSPGQNSVSFQIPQTPLSQWTIIIPESDVKINFSPSIATSTADDKTPKKESKQTTLHAFVGAVPEIKIAWTPKSEGATGLDALISTQVLQQTIIDEGIYRTTAEFDYSISRASISNLKINIPPDQKVVRITDSNIKKWEVKTTDNIQTINIDLFEPAKEKQRVRFELEKLFDFKEQQNINDKTKTSVKLSVPQLSAVGAGRQQGIAVIRTVNELNCETLNTTGLLRMDSTELPKQLQNIKWDAIYRITSHSYNLEVAVNKVKPQITVTSQANLQLNNNLSLENILIFNIEHAGIFQIKLHVPTTFKNYNIYPFSGKNFTGIQIDSHSIDPIKGNDKFKLMTIALSKKAIGNVGLIIRASNNSDNFDNKKSGESFDLPVILPTLPSDFAERFTGKLLLQVDDSFRVNPIEIEGVQPVSIQQIANQDWLLNKNNARSGFLFSQEIVAFKIQAEKRKPLLNIKEIHRVRVETGSVKHHVKFNYDIKFSGLNSIRIDLPEQISGRINLNSTNNNWRESQIVPPPEDIEKGYVAWEFSHSDKIRGIGNFDVNWEDVIAQPEVGKSIDITIPRLAPQKQQPADRIWGQIIVSKSESVDLGESDKSTGLKPIDPQNDVENSDRVNDAVAAFEFYDKWNLELIATQYKLEDVKRTSIEKGIIRANLFDSKKGVGVSAQALFKIRSVQQRLEMTLDQSAKISEVRINDRRVPLEADSTANYMIPLTSITPDTPFLLDVRYSIEPPSKNKIVIPTFNSLDSETNKTSGAAIQKANLSVFIPDKYYIVGYKGNWSKEFSYIKSNSGNLQIKYFAQYESAQLRNEFNIKQDDFQIAGKEFPFSTVHPDKDSSLKIRFISEGFSLVFFILLILYGILTIKIPFIKWSQITLAIIIVFILIGFISTTFAEYLTTLNAVYLGIATILICRLLELLISLRKIRITRKKNTKENNNENNNAENSTENNNTEQSPNSNNNIVTNNQEGE